VTVYIFLNVHKIIQMYGGSEIAVPPSIFGTSETQTTQDVNTIATKEGVDISTYSPPLVPAEGNVGYLQSGFLNAVPVSSNVVKSVITLPTLSEGTYLVLCNVRTQTASGAMTSRALEITSVIDTLAFGMTYKSSAYSTTSTTFIRTSDVVQVALGSTAVRYITVNIIGGTDVLVNTQWEIVKLQ